MDVNLQIPARLGAAIKDLRQSKGMTLRELADQTGLSSGFISKIEWNLSKPSIENLQKICYVLNVTVDDLAHLAAKDEENAPVMGESADNKLLVKKDQRALIYNLNDVIKLETIFADSAHYKLEVMTLTGDNAEYVSSKHKHDEIGVVASGILSITLNGEREYIMKEGDALLIPAETEHTIRKSPGAPCVSYWIKILNAVTHLDSDI